MKFSDFKTQVDHLILTERPDLVLINKKGELIVEQIVTSQWTTELK